MGFRDAHAGVGYGQYNRILPVLHCGSDTSPTVIIFDGVIQKIEQNRLMQLGDSGQHGAGTPDVQGDSRQFRGILQFQCRVLQLTEQIHTDPLHIRRTLVQPGQPEDILHQSDQPLGFRINLFIKSRCISPLHQAALQQLRITGDGMQGRFQFVGNIGRKFPAQGFRLLLLGQIQQEHRHTGENAVGFHRPGCRQISALSQGDRLLRLFSGQGCLCQRGDDAVPVCHGKVRANTVGGYLQQR